MCHYEAINNILNPFLNTFFVLPTFSLSYLTKKLISFPSQLFLLAIIWYINVQYPCTTVQHPPKCSVSFNLVKIQLPSELENVPLCPTITLPEGVFTTHDSYRRSRPRVHATG